MPSRAQGTSRSLWSMTMLTLVATAAVKARQMKPGCAHSLALLAERVAGAGVADRGGRLQRLLDVLLAGRAEPAGQRAVAGQDRWSGGQ